MKPEITYVSHGIANNFGEVIEVNKELLKYPSLYKAVLHHEFLHNDNQRNDFITDLGEYKVSNVELLNFMIRNPRSFSQFLPFYWHKTYGFVYDWSVIITYIIILMLITGIAYSILI
jgi:hypothetical protein